MPRPSGVGVVAALVVALTVGACGGIGATPTPSVAPRWSGPALTTEPMSATDSAAIDALAQQSMADIPDVPGMWIGVWDPQKGYYLQAYGDAEDGGTAAAVEQHGRIGSVTKTFTITAVLQQVAAGNLRLESTIGEMLPDLAVKYPAIKDITVDQLAGMRSGIPDYANTGVVIGDVVENPQRVFTVDELIDAAMTLPLSPAGTGGYSTTNTLILGEMLEKLTGKPVEQVVTEVAVAVGLEQTALQAPKVVALPERSSHGYVQSAGAASLQQVGATVEPGTDTTDWTVSWGQAGGGMYSTIADLGERAASGLGTSLLPEELAGKRLEFQTIPEGSYGLGMFDYGQGWIGHTGQLIGWESLVAYSTETGGAFVAIVNETGSLVVAESVAVQVFPDLRGLLPR